MAYAAVISLKQTINGLLQSSRILLISSTRETLEFAYNETASLQRVVETLYERSSESLAALDGEIRDCANELEDVLEFHESDQLYSRHEDEEVKEAIASFAEAVKKLEVEYIEELSCKGVVPQHNDAATLVPSNTDFGVEMVGRYKIFTEIRDHLLSRMRPDDMCFFLLIGQVGSGKRIVAKTIYEDKGKQFDCCAWVTIGTQYQLKQVLMQILSQVDNNPDHDDLLTWRGDEELCNHLCQVLEHQRYMIVLDDVRDVKVVDYLRRALPNRSDGSIVFVTSSLQEIVLLVDYYIKFDAPAQFFEECIWVILRGLIFGVHPISPELEEAGKKIVQNFQCSLISAAKALLFLHKTDKTVDKWREIASDRENPIFMVGDEISEMSNIKTEVQSNNWDMNDKRERSLVDMISLWGRGDDVENIKKMMQPERFFSNMQIISLYGMAGIGKSTLARKIFKEYELNLCHFDHHVWVTLGPKYETKEVLIDILTQIYPSIDKMHLKGDEDLVRELCIQLSGKRCLIVLDDICSQEPLHHLKNVIPYIMGTTLVTTRLAQVAKFLILTVADQLLKVDKTLEYWNNVASGKEKSVFKNAHDEISKALLPSYESLLQHLKVCFLYLGVFCNDYEIQAH